VRNRRGFGAALCTIALLLGVSPAGAIVPGDGCCADLEERLAALEEMAARKGNRKVKLEVSGLINQAILGWDDGAETNAYVVTNDNARSRLRFIGSADITSDLQAGYRLEVGVRAWNSKLVNQFGALDRRDGTLDIRDSVWFLKSKRRGTLFIGATFPSFTNVADSNVTQTDSFLKYSGVENTGFDMFVRSARDGELARTLTWRRLIGAGGNQPGESQRGFQLVKYVTPTWHGFSAAATLVADDFWDATLRYKGEVGGFKIAAAGGYLDLLPGSRSRGVCALNPIDPEGDATRCRQVGGSISALHEDTGLFLNLGFGMTLDGLLHETSRYAGTGVDETAPFWSGQAGIERRINALGKSTLYGEFYSYDGGAATIAQVGPDDPLNPTGSGVWSVWNSNVQVVGGGLAQGLDAADLVLYLAYGHVSGDVTLRQLQSEVANGPLAGAPIDDLDLLLTGAVINF
jgi:hypothetical protein